jgi:hypothetical protein
MSWGAVLQMKMRRRANQVRPVIPRRKLVDCTKPGRQGFSTLGPLFYSRAGTGNDALG